MADMVRVRDNETGHHFTIPRSRYDRNPSAYTELKSPALHVDGSLVRPKFRTTASTEAAKRNTNAGQSAEPKKEN